MFRVTIEQDLGDEINKCIVENDVEQLTDVIQILEQALRGVGFYFSGYLEISNPYNDKFDEPKYNTEEVIKKMAMIKKGKKSKPTPKGGIKKSC